MSGTRRFGDLLVERGFISDEELHEALRVQGHERKRLGQILVERGILSPDQLNWTLSELLGVPYVDLTEDMVDLEVARTLPEEVLRRHQAVPVLRVGDEMTVILTDPTDWRATQEIQALSGAQVRTALASTETVSKLLDRAFPRRAMTREATRYAEVAATAADGDPSGVAQLYDLLVDAVREGATEIHVEPRAEDVRVRYRVEGRLVDRPRLSRASLDPVLFRFRILAGLRGEARPVVAHVRTRLDGQETELDLLFFPTLHGEAVAVSLWPRQAAAPTLDAFVLEAGSPGDLERLLAEGGGLVFVTGGESRVRAAVLYALAQAASRPAGRTLTVERAAAFVLPDFVQVEAPAAYAEMAATVLDQSADVALVEDASAASTCLAALSLAERGALVLAGLPVSSNATGLAHLLAPGLPHRAVLAATRGLVQGRRQGPGYSASALTMTEELREELLHGRRNGHR